MYGGRAIDDFDRRVLKTYMDEYMGDFIFDTFQPFHFYHNEEVDYKIPEDGSRDNYTGKTKPYRWLWCWKCKKWLMLWMSIYGFLQSSHYIFGRSFSHELFGCSNLWLIFRLHWDLTSCQHPWSLWSASQCWDWLLHCCSPRHVEPPGGATTPDRRIRLWNQSGRLHRKDCQRCPG